MQLSLRLVLEPKQCAERTAPWRAGAWGIALLRKVEPGAVTLVK